MEQPVSASTSVLADDIERIASECLVRARAWTDWDGQPREIDGELWTPNKVLRRIADHLLDHLAEIDARLAGSTPSQRAWRGRTVTTASDLARFALVDFEEAQARISRLAECFATRIRTLDPARLDAPDGDAWTIRKIAEHMRGILSYVECFEPQQSEV